MHLLSRRALLSSISGAGIASTLAGQDTRERAPNFWAKTLDGDRYTNDTVKGKVLLVQFWTTWCPYCRRDHPSVETITDEFKDKDLIVLAVNIGEPKKKVRKYLEDSPRSCKIVLMEDTNLAAMFATKVYPVYVLIDRDGGLAGRQNGASGEDGLRRLLGQSWHGSGVSGGLMRAHDLRGRQRRRGKEPARLTSPQRPQPIDPFII